MGSDLRPAWFVTATCALLYVQCTPTVAQEPSPRTLWRHNGSIVYLMATGTRREFYYQAPRPAMVQAGARQGSLLFSGETINWRYVGTAYVYNVRCGRLSYQVNGPILDNYERVIVQGEVPRVDHNCRAIGHLTDTLEFTLLNSEGVASSQTSMDNALPRDFLGSWIKKTNGTEGMVINGIWIGQRSYHETGYNCKVNRVASAGDSADSDDRVYVVNMTCQNDGYQPPPAEQVHEVWALRNVNGGDVLITSSATSIQVLQREQLEDREK